MDYFFYCRDKAGTAAIRKQLVETHWSFMDGYASRMSASGPLLSEDGKQWRGSAMMVELADRAAVDAMIRDDPYSKAGLYETVEVHYWRFGGRR